MKEIIVWLTVAFALGIAIGVLVLPITHVLEYQWNEGLKHYHEYKAKAQEWDQLKAQVYFETGGQVAWNPFTRRFEDVKKTPEQAPQGE